MLKKSKLPKKFVNAMKYNPCLLFFVFFFTNSIFSISQDKIDVLILNKDYEQALQEIDNQIDQNPNANLFFKKGMVCSSLQNYQEALDAYTQALQYEPENPEILTEIAENLSLLGNNMDAEEFYKKAILLNPNDLVLKSKLGRVYINQRKNKPAYDLFTKIYSVDSTNVFWNKQLAYCSFKINRRTQAIYLYKKILESYPRDYSVYSNLIHTYNWKKEGDEILEVIRKGLDEFPHDAELILERANYFFRTKMYELAMSDFHNYFENGGDSIYEIAMNYGISTYFAGFTEEALVTFNDLNRANPMDAIVMYYQSLCYKKLKNFEESEKLMQWAIDFSTPDYVADMYHHLGQIYGQQRKFKESIEALEKSYELDPRNYEILFEIATTYEEFNSNKTLALNYYNIYLKEAGENGRNVNYALDRITRIKEDLFFEE